MNTREKVIYNLGTQHGEERAMMKLYHWLMDVNREPAQTYFTSGWTRNVAKEIEFRLNEKIKRS